MPAKGHHAQPVPQAAAQPAPDAKEIEPEAPVAQPQAVPPAAQPLQPLQPMPLLGPAPVAVKPSRKGLLDGFQTCPDLAAYFVLDHFVTEDGKHIPAEVNKEFISLLGFPTNMGEYMQPSQRYCNLHVNGCGRG